MRQNNRPVRYCIFCGKANNPSWQYCNYCGKELYPDENQLKDYAIKEIKDQLKDKAVDTVFDKLKHFLLAHLYGIVLTASVVFTGVSAVSVLGTGDIPKEARQVTSPPAVDILGNLADGSENTSPAAEERETASVPAEEPLSETEAVDFLDVYHAYLPLLSEARGDDPGYYIYDIDKDGIPELILTVQETYESHSISRGHEVWYYADGTAKSAGIVWGFAHGRPDLASYPDGNGLVCIETARMYECIWLVSLDKEQGTLSDDANTEESNVLTRPVDDGNVHYYVNIYEPPYYVFDNHPFKAVTENPFFEDSKLLGFNDPADDTDLKEALGL